MSSVTPEQAPAPAEQPFPQASAPTENLTPSPDTGLEQAPESAVAEQGVQGAPEEPQEQPQHPQVSYEEFQKLQAQYQEKENLLSRLEQMANEQRQREQEQEYANGLRRNIQEKVAKRAMNLDSDEEVTEVVYEFVNEVLGTTRQQYQSEVDQYHQSVEQALWQATKGGYADHLMQENNLPPSVKVNLLAFDNEQSMTLAAQQFKEALAAVQQQQVQQQTQQQIQQRRANGTFAQSPPDGGSPPPKIQPGTAKSLEAALAAGLGLRRPQ